MSSSQTLQILCAQNYSFIYIAGGDNMLASALQAQKQWETFSPGKHQG